MSTPWLSSIAAAAAAAGEMSDLSLHTVHTPPLGPEFRVWSNGWKPPLATTETSEEKEEATFLSKTEETAKRNNPNIHQQISSRMH